MNAFLAKSLRNTTKAADRASAAPIKDRGQVPTGVILALACAEGTPEQQAAFEAIRLQALRIDREVKDVMRDAKVAYLTDRAAKIGS